MIVTDKIHSDCLWHSFRFPTSLKWYVYTFNDYCDIYVSQSTKLPKVFLYRLVFFFPPLHNVQILHKLEAIPIDLIATAYNGFGLLDTILVDKSDIPYNHRLEDTTLPNPVDNARSYHIRTAKKEFVLWWLVKWIIVKRYYIPFLDNFLLNRQESHCHSCVESTELELFTLSGISKDTARVVHVKSFIECRYRLIIRWIKHMIAKKKLWVVVVDFIKESKWSSQHLHSEYTKRSRCLINHR